MYEAYTDFYKRPLFAASITVSYFAPTNMIIFLDAENNQLVLSRSILRNIFPLADFGMLEIISTPPRNLL